MSSGKTQGLKAFEVSNGGELDFTVLEGRCLDIFNMRYKGVNLNFVTKSGLISQSLSVPQGAEAMRSLSGGMIYTCGLSNVGNVCTYKGVEQVFHGRIRAVPAENVAISCAWEGDDYTMCISGEMKEAQIFRENLVLHRTITTKLGEKKIRLCDCIENLGFEQQEHMQLNHINIGYPVLDQGARLIAPVLGITPRDEASKAGMSEYNMITEPNDQGTEQVFYIDPASDEAGNTMAALINDRLQLGVYIRYNLKHLPNLIYWKSMGSGDYAVGLEPANCRSEGKVKENERGTLRMIQPFETITHEMELGVLDGKTEIDNFTKEIEHINNRHKE